MKSRYICFFIILISILICYSNSVGNDFVWDDSWLIQKNPNITDFKNIPLLFSNHLGSAAPGENNFYRPLQELSLMVDYFLWGKFAFGYHITNILLHFFVTILVFLIGIKVLEDKLAVFIGTIFYAIHPVHTQAVTYIAGRADILMSLFACLSFYLFIKGEEKNRIAYYALSTIFYVLAVISKEVAIILPFIMIIYVISMRDKEERYNMKRMIAVFSPYIVLSVFYIISRLTFLDFSKNLPLTVIEGAPIGMRLITFLKTLCLYVWILILPFNLHMERSLPIPEELTLQNLLSTTAIIIVVIWLFIVSYKRNRRLFFLFSWFIIGLLPVSNLYPINATMAEHWLYFPSIAIFLIFGVFVSYLFYRYKSRIIKTVIMVLLIIIYIFYSAQTIARNRDWKDAKTIFENTLKYAPGAYKVWNNLGSYYNKNSDYDNAINCFKKAIAINNSHYLSYDNMSYSYFKKGNHEQAIKVIEDYIVLYPDALKPRMRLAYIYEKMQNKKKALEEYRKALIFFPGNEEIMRRINELEKTSQ